MKARITCDSEHILGKMFEQHYDVTYFSRRTNFDLHSWQNVQDFLKDTENYDLTINMSRGMPFGQVNLLMDLEKYCDSIKLKHKILSIGSYVGTVLMNHPTSSYDVEKMALKLAHRKIANEYMFFEGSLDSYLVNVNYLEHLSPDVEREYPHIKLLDLDSVIRNCKYMLDNQHVKEMYIQRKQPGNYRINDGYGAVFPGVL